MTATNEQVTDHVPCYPKIPLLTRQDTQTNEQTNNNHKQKQFLVCHYLLQK